ncbi:MAG: glycoside hydrolase family 31 protein [Kiritimatiellaeota bacterium]|nr:glycoside hydrolase family 31 protein [Kiritimatiellota bacterium]
MTPPEKQTVVEIDAGPVVTRLDVPATGIVRVRRFPAGGTAPESPLNRYGLIMESDAPAAVEMSRDDAGIMARTGAGSIRVAADSGRIEVCSASGKDVFRETAAPAISDAAEVSLAVPDDLQFFGLGDQTRDRIEHRGTRGDLWVRNVKSYIPIPVLFTNSGVGLLINTTRRVRYDLAASTPDRICLTVPNGEWDVYFFLADSLPGQIDLYTQLTGRPFLPPKWAFGLWFISRTQADAREFVDDCRAFRQYGIPCDAISLEPGWMAGNYDFSTKKDWHPERFPIPPYAPSGPHNFLPAVRRMGFKPGLWLCCDYDLSWEEERRLQRKAALESGNAEAGDVGTFAAGYEQDEHLGGIRRMDTQTIPEEPWFEHLKKFVDQGVCYFKQDGANQVLSHPDRLYANGMRDDEMHNLYPLLYSRQMSEGFAEHTGRRPFGFTVSGWAGLQHYTGTWTGDTGGEEGPLGACLNCSLSGHNMTTVDMEVTTPRGIHFGFFLPWAQLDSWNYWRHPWYQGERIERIFREYARLRYRLLPYLYSCAWEAATTGMPLLRPMPLAFPDDPASTEQMRQYMLGPALLVGAFTEKLHLPAGAWTDFWSGQPALGPVDMVTDVPENRGGPVFVPAGAILPMGPVMDYVGQRPDDELELRIYPGADNAFTLYEDDGETFAHRNGEYRTTEIGLESDPNGGVLRIGPARGAYPGACELRKLEIVFCGVRGAVSATVNGERVAVEPAESERGPEWRITLGRVPVSAPIMLEFRASDTRCDRR